MNTNRTRKYYYFKISELRVVFLNGLKNKKHLFLKEGAIPSAKAGLKIQPLLLFFINL
ncbi:MAG: hypothetical protein H8E42_00525 [Nitrospinae bacterium]|nr:hypothetical protein [Nitrospinota bacterium]MBL7021429.1 hypothetical protein [Nitrospinaceae bacterium]